MNVSAVSLGVMGMSVGRGAVPPRKMMIKLIQDAYDRGVDFFDTAEIYGPHVNEELLGEAIRPFKNRAIIATKFSGDYRTGSITGDSRPETIKRAVEGSLKRLNIDCIDLYYQHRVDRNTPIEETAGAVSDLIKEGKVKHFGLSEISSTTLRRAHAVQSVTAVQSQYSLMFRKPETEIISTLEELNIGFLPYSPLDRGFLGGGITEHTALNGARATWPRYQKEAIRENTRIFEVVSEFGRTRGMTPAQVSLTWMLSKYPKFVVPLFGTTKLSHLEEDIRSLDFKFSQSEIKELEDGVDKFTIVGDRYDRANQEKVEY